VKILQVIHGYPMRFNAGSEIYTQMLVHNLVRKGYEVAVFSRIENPFIPDYELIEEVDEFDTNHVPLFLVNVARQKDRYQSDGVDAQFEKVLASFNPDVVNFQHLNHLSLGLVKLASEFESKIVFTLHDFWLACPRGQFLQINYGEENCYQLCDGQEDLKCATHCYSRYHTGLQLDADLEYWTNWVSSRQQIIRKFIPLVDTFIAPSQQLLQRMRDELPMHNDQIIYLDYGFDLSRLEGRDRKKEDNVVFGYIGTHIVAKGIDLLIRAFAELDGKATLRIWGRTRSETTPYLKQLIDDLELPPRLTVEWRPEYRNSQIVPDVFDQVDVIVITSIWNENSPLVIHEAQQCRIPVITAKAGGMAEYVCHEKNGLLFTHRDYRSLAEQMQRMVNNPTLIENLGQRGYLFSEDGDVLSMEEHIQQLLEVYHQ